MKNKWLILLKIQLSGQFRLKEKSKGKVMMMIAYGTLGSMLCLYSFMLAIGYCSMGMPEVVPSYAAAITGLMTLFFTAFKTNGVIFGNKDYDLLMSLPVKTSTVITSRFLTMYILNAVFTALIMIPMGLAYVIYVKPVFMFYPIWIISTFIMPLIPTTLATLIGVFIILFSSRFKYANAITTIVSFGVTIVIIIFSVGMGGMDESQFNTVNLSSLGAALLEQIHRIYPVAVLLNKAVIGDSVKNFFILIGGSVGWYYLFIKVVSVGYKKMNTELMTYHVHSDFKMSRLKTNAPLVSICKKELKRFFSSTIYVLNMGMGLVMAVLLAGACVFVGIDKILAALEISEMSEIITVMAPFLVITCLGMTCTTSVSLSLEGKNLWIMKSLPITDFMIFQGKLLMNLTIQIPISLLCSVLFWIGLKPGLTNGLLLIITPIVCCCFITVFGMVLNASMPNYQWTSETTIIKQSASSMITIFTGMLNGILPMVFLGIFHKYNGTMITGIFTVLEGMITWALYMKLKKMKI